MSNSQISYMPIPTERFKEQYSIVRKPGTFKLKVRGVSRPMPSLSTLEGVEEQRIVNFYAVDEQNAMEAVANQTENGIPVDAFSNLSYAVQDNDPIYDRLDEILRGEEVKVSKKESISNWIHSPTH